MTSVIWSASTGDWNTAANWSPAAVPIDGDSVYFTGSNVTSVTSGLTLAAAGDSLVELNVGADYTGSIGTSGGKLIAGVGITTIRMAARGGKLFVNPAACTTCILEAAGGITDFFETAGTVTTIRCVGCAGSWAITNGSAITNIEMVSSPNCTCTIGTGVTALNSIRLAGGGRIVNNSAVSAGTAPRILVEGAEYQHEVGAVTKFEIGQGGLVKYNGSSTITDLILLPGAVFDGRANRNTAVTITNLYPYPGSTCYLNNALNSFTVTTRYELGGQVITQLGRTAAL